MRNRRFLPKKRRGGRPILRERKEHDPYAFRPSIEGRLKRVFEGIGVPERGPFRPDPFQTEALQALEGSDVLVSAPTGAGKTWIAVEAIRRALGKGQRAWYASPLKALSNSKYEELSEAFGAERIGILTGDRKENPDAPVIVGTTEILRNQLYDAMETGVDLPIHLAVLDEAHYIDDPDRGVVWEEVLIYLPRRVRLLLLSATIHNAGEIASWLEEIRDTPCRVVESSVRPVPLVPLFLFPDGHLCSLTDRRGRLSSKVQKEMDREGSSKKRSPDIPTVVEGLRHWNLVPAIFFLKSRAECDETLEKFRRRSRGMDEAFRNDLDRFLDRFPFLRTHRQLPALRSFRIGSHHAGQLPQWKLLVEKMMDAGHLDAIFSTSTVAAGVNFPARTVVLVQSDRYNGREFVDLSATELQQMAGRAGRRGKDRVGFALVLPGLYQDPRRISRLLASPPEPIQSQIRIGFSMVLNLLLSHSMESIHELLRLSLAAFQERKAHPDLEARWQEWRREIEVQLPHGRCGSHDPERILGFIRNHRRLREALSNLRKESRKSAEREELLFSLVPGRLFRHRNGGLYVAFRAFPNEERPYCLAQKIHGRIRTRPSGIRLKRIPLERIREFMDYRIDLPLDLSSRQLRDLLEAVPVDEIRPLRIPQRDREDPEARILKESLRALPCEGCPCAKECQSRMASLEKVFVEIDHVRERLWRDFTRHVEFLRMTGFVDADGGLTPDGRWASQLRIDEPLLIAEAIRKGALDELDPARVASLLAPFVLDRGREVFLYEDGVEGLKEIREAFDGMMERIRGMVRLKQSWGFDTPPLAYWPSVALYLWARGRSWRDLLRSVPVEEGDMVSLIVRTMDHLRQVASLETTHPSIAERAREAIALIQREPAYIP